MLRGGGGDDMLYGGLGRDEVQFRGSKAQYTVTVEGAGWRIVDSVAGRDGSTYVESVEVLRFLTGNTTTLLVPAAPAEDGTADKGHPAQVSPLAEGEDHFGPLVLPVESDARSWDDPFVLPSAPDDQPLVLPAAEADKFADDALVLPGAEGPAHPLFADLEMRLELNGDRMLILGPDGRLIDEPALRGVDWMI